MNDEELLELAALAVGIDPSRINPCQRENGPNPWIEKWNPLDDDGDALRLMVVLRLDILWAEHERSVVVCNDSSNDDPVTEKVRFTTDPLAATRRAIVRAAAEIGKSMKGKND